ncbi:hypothetical protein [Streptomyces sp. NBC_01445]|uniref:hypothetical protein n=1 Tax=Streptomyces sp. NBC_01445 TaxID=2903869 RepID=UPI002DD9CB32|nr:hypothetical protein [Streptomyces sp. NBC_01445]WSE03763.1 hypothetical protein OG574_10525 [Streptomyces sp. NBC_01445]
MRGVLEAALATTRRLHGTIEEVLWLSCSAAPDPPVARLLHETEERWHGPLARDGRGL